MSQHQPPEKNEQKLPFPLTADARTPTKSKDDVEAKYDEDWSAMRSGRTGREMYCYVVDNHTKHNQYTVELFIDDRGAPHASCDCVASVICKHVKQALEEHLRLDPNFLGEQNEQQPTN